MKGTVILTADASGAAEAAAAGRLVVVVDIIDFSTTMEAALDAGALAVYGAAPDAARPPVAVSPALIGKMAGETALRNNTDVVLVAEPRVGSDEQRIKSAEKAVGGIRDAGAAIGAVLPNIGAETMRLADLSGRVVLGATGTGGVAYDAAVTAGAPIVLTGTVARTTKKKGTVPALEAARRAVEAAKRINAGIALVAASGNSLEDMLAAEYIYNVVADLLRR